jgi:two-component system, LuxR family, response regulator FixJ
LRWINAAPPAGGIDGPMIHDAITRTVLRMAPIEMRRPVVAVVDDDPAVCSSLKFSLELEGFVVRTFASGAEILNAGDLAACSCLVVDQRMPGMSGMELIARLRERKVVTPAVLIVSHANAALSARAAKAHVPIVEKPLLGDTLLDCIRGACQR